MQILRSESQEQLYVTTWEWSRENRAVFHREAWGQWRRFVDRPLEDLFALPVHPGIPESASCPGRVTLAKEFHAPRLYGAPHYSALASLDSMCRRSKSR